MILLLVINAFADVFGLATILVLIKSALENNLFSSTYDSNSAGSEIEYYFNESLRWLYDASGADSSVQFLFYTSIFIFLVFLVKNAISLWIGFIQTRYAFNVSKRLNLKMFKHYYDEGYLFIQDDNSGKKVYNIVDIPMRFANNYLNPVFQFSTELLVILILCLGLLLYRPLAIIMLAVIVLPVFAGIYQFSKRRVATVGYERNRISPINYAKVIESMNSYVDIKLANKENQQIREYEQSQAELNKVDIVYNGVYNKIHQKTNDIIFGLGILVIFGYALISGIRNETILTLLGFFGIAAYKVLPAVNRMMNAILVIKNSSFVVDELKIIAKHPLQDFDTVDKLSVNDSIALENISFEYPGTDKTVLDNISLRIKKGENIGIVGASGSGKTTLLKLILRLINESSGKMTIDETHLRSKELDAAFQLNIGYVEQSVFITNGTLAENIAFGEKDIDQDRLNRAIEDSMLSDFIQQHKEGLDLELGENGVKLSGGQKQRVGIARALYKNAEILVFDEVTSALDPVTEKAIVKSINHIASLGKTVIIVAHRITTLEKCDRIIELKDGRIIGEPAYSELLSKIVA